MSTFIINEIGTIKLGPWAPSKARVVRRYHVGGSLSRATFELLEDHGPFSKGHQTFQIIADVFTPSVAS